MTRNTIFSIIELVLSFVGAAIAGIIYYADRASIDLPCSTGGGCSLVAASRWAHIFGIPVSLLGFVGYGLLAILSVLKLTSTSEFASKARLGMLCVAFVGVAYSWFLQYVSHVYIGAICSWCMTSAITMTVLFFTLVAEQLGRNASRSMAAA
jgi:uncharacterized membrane protein